MSRTNGADMKAVSPFLISKAISGLAGAVKSIKKWCTGSLLIETASSAQFTALMQASALGPYPIQVEAHWQLNFSRGMISCFDLREVSTDEIAADLEAQYLVAVQHLQSHCNGVLQPTASLILTFSRPTLPEKLNVAFTGCLSIFVFLILCATSSVNGLAILNWPANLRLCGKCGKDAHDDDC